MSDLNQPVPHVVPRAAVDRIRAAMRVHPVIVVTGARQTGKSTLLADPRLARGRTVLNLDESQVRRELLADPDSILSGPGEFVLDEVQREPELMLALKRAVDAMGPAREPGKFLVTGSANLLLMSRVSDSLAGRAGYATLWPLTRREQLGLGVTGRWSELLAAPPSAWHTLTDGMPDQAPDWRALVRRGGMPIPALHLADDDARSDWFAAYLDTYLDRDLRDLAAIQHIADFRTLMEAAAGRIGNITDQTALGRDASLQQQKVRLWLNILETSYQLVRIAAYAPTTPARLVKSPKLYWADAGLGWHLAGAPEPTGFHFENVVALDLLAWRALQLRRPEIRHWRTSRQDEVDFVIEDGRRLLGIEIKTTKRVSLSDATGLIAMSKSYPKQFHGGVILYGGRDVIPLGGMVTALPWWSVL